MKDCQKLLEEYIESGSDSAFRELVSRYLDLVYSVAVRLVDGDTHRAEDVAQSVFVDLARMARTFSSDVMLGGWLHRHTCFVAANTMRGERRRQFRENQAVEMNALHDRSDADFRLIEPILDEAINELGDADRTAILLRFFQQLDFRSVGEALGSNEDAARMRVNRALQKLQSLLERRGVTNTAGALGLVLSASAVQAAPVGLALTISTAGLAGTVAAGSVAIAATNTIVMTTIQKTVIGVALATTIGAGIYQTREVNALHRQQTPLMEEIQQLRGEREAGRFQMAELRDENERLRRARPEIPGSPGEAPQTRTGSTAEEPSGSASAGRENFTTNLLSSASDYAKEHAKSQVLQRVARMREELALTADQEEQILNILLERVESNHNKISQVMTGEADRNAPDDWHQARQQDEESIMALLSQEQQLAFDELTEEENFERASSIARSQVAGMTALRLSEEQKDQAYWALYNLNWDQQAAAADPSRLPAGDHASYERQQLERQLQALEGVLSPEQRQIYVQQREAEIERMEEMLRIFSPPGNRSPE